VGAAEEEGALVDDAGTGPDEEAPADEAPAEEGAVSEEEGGASEEDVTPGEEVDPEEGSTRDDGGSVPEDDADDDEENKEDDEDGDAEEGSLLARLSSGGHPADRVRRREVTSAVLTVHVRGVAVMGFSRGGRGFGGRARFHCWVRAPRPSGWPQPATLGNDACFIVQSRRSGTRCAAGAPLHPPAGPGT
jgi:hypothetical protein